MFRRINTKTYTRWRQRATVAAGTILILATYCVGFMFSPISPLWSASTLNLPVSKLRLYAVDEASTFSGGPAANGNAAAAAANNSTIGGGDRQQKSSSSSSSSKKSEDVPYNPKKINTKRTLYDILGADQNDPRDVLKKRYVAMAKRSHPDAMLARQYTGKKVSAEDEELDFKEIAAAWEILSDRKSRRRYDRALQAELFSENVSRMASQNFDQVVDRAGPAVSAIFGKVAVPFLRRTTATTWAVAQAVGENFSKSMNDQQQKQNAKNNDSAKSTSSSSSNNNKNSGSTTQQEPSKMKWTNALMNALQAGQRAGQVIDSMELREKSKELEERAQKEMSHSYKLKDELQNITETRLLATLDTPNAALSSAEAFKVLEKIDPGDTISILDRAMLRNTIEHEINSLRDAEINFSDRLNEYEEMDSHWQELLKEQEDAKRELEECKRVEIEARQALFRAQQRVVECKDKLVGTSNSLKSVEFKVRRTASEMDRVSSQLTKKQERVRDALKRKSDIMDKDLPSKTYTVADLAALRRKELQLTGETARTDRTVARLLSRSRKLEVRARAIEKYQESDKTDLDLKQLQNDLDEEKNSYNEDEIEANLEAEIANMDLPVNGDFAI